MFRVITFGLLVFAASGCSIRRFRFQNQETAKLPTSGIYSWTADSIPNLHQAVVATDKSVWAVGDRGYVLQSADGGENWTEHWVGGIDLYSITIDQNGIIFVAGSEGVAFRSKDQGKNWESIPTGTTANLVGICAAGRAIWVVGSNGTVLRSEDTGDSWVHLDAIKDINLRSVSPSADGQHVFVTGESGTIFIGDENGKNFRNVRTATPQETVFQVWPIDQHVLIAVGTAGLILKSTDGGVTWTTVPSGILGGLASIVGTTDGKDLWACGDDGVLIHSDDAGVSWHRLSFPLNRGLNWVTRAGEDVIVVGWRGSVIKSSRSGVLRVVRATQPYRMGGLFQTAHHGLLSFGQGGTLLRSVDSGANWQRLEFDRDSEFRSAAESGSTTWVVGDHETIAFTYDGEHWDWVKNLRDVRLNGIAVSADGKNIVAVGEGGLVVVSVDSGTTWTNAIPLSDVNLNAVCLLGNTAFVVGNNGTVIKAALPFNHWTNVAVNASDDLKAVLAAPDGRRLWIFGNSSRILYSHDAGVTWETDDNDFRDAFLSATCVRNCQQVLVVGENGTVAIGENEKWDYFTKTRFSLRSITASGDSIFTLGSDFKIFHPANVKSAWQTDELSDTYGAFVSANRSDIWLSGTGKLWHSRDNGQTWEVKDLGNKLDFYGIVGDPSGLRLWAVGAQGILASSTSGGSEWSTKKIAPATLLNIRRIAGRIWAVGYQGKILSYDARQDDWITSNQNDSNSLFDIAGDADGKELWVVGGHGAVLHSADEGRTWESQTVAGTTATLRSLVILDGSPKTIVVVGDGGTIAVSRNNGRNWIVNQYGTAALQSIALSERTRQLFTVGDEGALFISDDYGITWNEGTSGTTNQLYAVTPAVNGELLYANGIFGTFQTYNLRSQRFSVGSIDAGQTLGKIHAEIELHNLNKTASTKFTVRAIRSNEADLRSPIELPVEVSPPSGKSDKWMVSFDLNSLSPHRGESFDLQLCLNQSKYSRCFPMSPLTVVPWFDFNANKYWVVPLALLPALIISLTLLLFTRPLLLLSLYQSTTVYELVEASSFPGSSFIRILFHGTMLPYFAFHRRTLDAWIRKHRESFRSHWTVSKQVKLQKNSKTSLDNNSVKPETNGSKSEQYGSFYVPLPVEVRRADSVSVVAEPSPSAFGSLFDSSTVIEIRGPGGIGKTTLLVQLAKWLSDPGETKHLSNNLAVPVSLPPSDSSIEEELLRIVKTISGEGIPLPFLQQLLSTGRLVVFVDGFSEASAEAQRKMVNELRRFSIGSLVVSSRLPVGFTNANQIELLPQQLDSRTLLYFITLLLSRLPSEKVALNTLELQLEIARRLVQIIKTSVGELPLTPLLVTLFVSRAVELLAQKQDLNNLPDSAPEAYFEFIRQLIRNKGFADTDSVLEGIKALAKVSLGTRFVASRVSSEKALRTLQPIFGEASSNVLQSLLTAGLLREEEIGLTSAIQFSLDSLAEFSAAYAYAEDCGTELEKWKQFAGQLNEAGYEASGFRAAMACIIETYSTALEMPKSVLTLLSPVKTAAAVEVGADQT